MVLKCTEKVIKKIAGEEVLELVSFLEEKEFVSEIEIAEELQIEMNAARSMLYKLYHVNLATYDRRKDKKRGLYVYHWSFDATRVPIIAKDMTIKRIDKLKEKVKLAHEPCFACDNNCSRVEFDQAIYFDFKCPECGQIMNHFSREKEIQKMNEEIKKLEKSIK